MVDGHCFVTLPLTINETLKWLSFAAYRNAEIILVVTVAARFVTRVTKRVKFVALPGRVFTAACFIATW